MEIFLGFFGLIRHLLSPQQLNYDSDLFSLPSYLIQPCMIILRSLILLMLYCSKHIIWQSFSMTLSFRKYLKASEILERCTHEGNYNLPKENSETVLRWSSDNLFYVGGGINTNWSLGKLPCYSRKCSHIIISNIWQIDLLSYLQASSLSVAVFCDRVFGINIKTTIFWQ